MAKRDIGAEIIEGLAAALAHKKGEASLPMHQVDIPDVKAIREKLELSQSRFAVLANVSLRTLQNWEQGTRTPDGAAIALLRALDNDPENVIRAINA